VASDGATGGGGGLSGPLGPSGALGLSEAPEPPRPPALSTPPSASPVALEVSGAFVGSVAAAAGGAAPAVCAGSTVACGPLEEPRGTWVHLCAFAWCLARLALWPRQLARSPGRRRRLAACTADRALRATGRAPELPAQNAAASAARTKRATKMRALARARLICMGRFPCAAIRSAASRSVRRGVEVRFGVSPLSAVDCQLCSCAAWLGRSSGRRPADTSDPQHARAARVAGVLQPFLVPAGGRPPIGRAEMRQVISCVRALPVYQLPETNRMIGPKLHAAGAPTICRPGIEV